MSDDESRLPTELLLMAQIRRLSDQGIAVYVARKGAADSGSILVRVPGPEIRTSRVWSQARDLDGTLGWLPAFNGEAVADDEMTGYIDRAIRRDPDLWVVEAEPRDGRNPFDGKEISPWPAHPPQTTKLSGRPEAPSSSAGDAQAARAAAEALFKKP